MHTKPHWRVILTAAVGVAIASYVALLIALNFTTPANALSSVRYVSWIGLAVFLLWLVFEKWAWAWLPEWIVQRPNLNGTWKGTGRLTFIKDRDLVKNPVTLKVEITIKQTYTTVFLLFWSRSSNDQRQTTSEAYVDLVQRSQGVGKYVLQYMFTTDPGAFFPNQPGCATLTFSTTPSCRLVGEWVFNPASHAAGWLEVTKQ